MPVPRWGCLRVLTKSPKAPGQSVGVMLVVVSASASGDGGNGSRQGSLLGTCGKGKGTWGGRRRQAYGMMRKERRTCQCLLHSCGCTALNSVSPMRLSEKPIAPASSGATRTRSGRSIWGGPEVSVDDCGNRISTSQHCLHPPTVLGESQSWQ